MGELSGERDRERERDRECGGERGDGINGKKIGENEREIRENTGNLFTIKSSQQQFT